MNEILNTLDDELFDLAYQEGKTISECLYDVYEKGRKDAIDECFKKIEQRLNDDTEISFDLPVEEVLGEDIDMDDFLMLAEEIVQEYKRLIFSKLREAKYQLKEKSR